MKTKHPDPLDKTDMAGFLSGALRIQWRRCGKPNCHCQTGEPHGPYYYRAWRVNGKLCWQYVKRSEVETVRAACENRREFQATLRGMRIEHTQALQGLRDLLRDLERQLR